MIVGLMKEDLEAQQDTKTTETEAMNVIARTGQGDGIGIATIIIEIVVDLTIIKIESSQDRNIDHQRP